MCAALYDMSQLLPLIQLQPHTTYIQLATQVVSHHNTVALRDLYFTTSMETTPVIMGNVTGDVCGALTKGLKLMIHNGVDLT